METLTYGVSKGRHTNFSIFSEKYLNEDFKLSGSTLVAEALHKSYDDKVKYNTLGVVSIGVSVLSIASLFVLKSWAFLGLVGFISSLSGMGAAFTKSDEQIGTFIKAAESYIKINHPEELPQVENHKKNANVKNMIKSLFKKKNNKLGDIYE